MRYFHSEIISIKVKNIYQRGKYLYKWKTSIQKYLLSKWKLSLWKLKINEIIFDMPLIEITASLNINIKSSCWSKVKIILHGYMWHDWPQYKMEEIYLLLLFCKPPLQQGSLQVSMQERPTHTVQNWTWSPLFIQTPFDRYLIAEL